MDPVTAAIVTILGKYAIDAGATLAKEAGPAAKEIAARLGGKVLGYLRRKPEGKAIADGYDKNPQGYEAPLGDQVEAAIQADAALKAELEQLIEQYKTEEQAFQATIQVKVGKGGAAAVGDKAVAVAERGVYVKGDVQGGITTGDQSGDPEKK
jgi:hypothetical protein